MLLWALIAGTVMLGAFALGFGLFSSYAIAKLLFFIFLVVFVVSLIAHLITGDGSNIQP